MGSIQKTNTFEKDRNITYLVPVSDIIDIKKEEIYKNQYIVEEIE